MSGSTTAIGRLGTLLTLAVAALVPGAASSQDMLRHVDLASEAMTVPELTRDDVVAASRSGRVDLPAKRLATLDLSGLQLEGATLRGAYLNDADLSDATLTDAVLDQAWAMRLDLTGADLSGASLFAAQMQGANLSEANLSGARITADLTNATLTGADLSGADLGADMKNQSMGLVRAVLASAKLDGDGLHGARTLPRWTSSSHRSWARTSRTPTSPAPSLPARTSPVRS